MHNLSHIAVILDGNRRFAKRLMLEPWKGHEYGAKKVEDFLDWCIEAGIKELTLYSFSIQNFNRPKDEFDYLMNLIRDAFKKFITDEKSRDKIKKHGIRINIIGRYKMFPKDVVDALEKVMQETRGNTGFMMNFALAYGGREEIVDAMKKIASKVANKELRPEEIDEHMIDENVYLASKPDVIIRTGGEKRTSNFLAWQSAYSELFFVDKMWPELTKEDFHQILEEYSKRERRFGK